ncbi:(2Fe-2S)-binding protein [Evansella sp. LMS18]|uniref:(2Fe-2S)-binding protein n=1 Tax=Evansella sp. LMS18 TaxID=2924033 RepID=UPI0020D10934|nr:(2Fe-2S)-binding protein [Evansella sp. LMS18]UTR09796.1 (2Fe-2S)-binding protein [Evansella sp. LMS18]
MTGRAALFHINGEEYNVYIRHADTLLAVIRGKAGYTGSKPGCLNGDCGACTVMVNGWPAKSCLMLALEAEGEEIITAEGLHGSEIQKAFVKYFAFQCGYCTPGFILNCQSLVTQYPEADRNKIKEWLDSNICRCTSYEEIEQAVYSVLREQR